MFRRYHRTEYSLPLARPPFVGNLQPNKSRGVPFFDFVPCMIHSSTVSILLRSLHKSKKPSNDLAISSKRNGRNDDGFQRLSSSI